VIFKTLKESWNGQSFFKSVYCLSGLGIVRKNRRIQKYLISKKTFALNPSHYFYMVFCSFLTIL